MRPRRLASAILWAALFIALAGQAARAQDPVPKVDVFFQGNSNLSESFLRRVLVDPLLDVGVRGARAADVDDAAYELTLIYLDEGYAFAAVTWSIAEPTDALREVTYLIDEGPLVLVESITFEGNQEFDDETLAKLYAAPTPGLLGLGNKLYVESRMNDLASDVESLYRGQGYDEVQVSRPEVVFSEDRSRALANLVVTEGPPFEVRAITFSGNELLSDEQVTAAVTPLIGERYRRRLMFELRILVEQLLANHGFADAEVDVDEVVRDPAGTVDLHVSMVEGQRVTIGRILVEGQEETDEEFIRERIPFVPGDVWSGSVQRRVSRSLLATGLFRSVSVGLEGDGPVRDFVVRVQDAKSLELYVKPGYGAYERARLSAGIRENNLFGTGRSANLEAGISTKGEFIELTLSDPWLLGDNRVLSLPISYRKREEPSFTQRNRTIGLHLRQRWTSDLSTTIGTEYQVSSVSNVDPDVDPDLTDDSQVASVFTQVRHDTRDRIFNPTTGHVGTGYVEYATPWLGADLQFFRMEGSIAQFWPLTEQTVLAVSARSGFILPTNGTDEIPLQYRYFNGGENSVRSFKYSELGPKDDKDEPVGGETVNTLNIEGRYNWSQAWQSAVFFDYGNVGLTTSDYFDDFRAGVGVGQRYLLPVGSVRLDIGVNPSPRDEEDRWVAQLAIGMAF